MTHTAETTTKSHSRPYKSNVNPFSEAHFKTMKYCPSFPERFGFMLDGKLFCRDFFAWYNQEHRHGGINMLTPAMVHNGQAEQILEDAYEKNPIRFRRKCPCPGELPQAVLIHKPNEKVVKEEKIVVKFYSLNCYAACLTGPDRFRMAFLRNHALLKF